MKTQWRGSIHWLLRDAMVLDTYKLFRNWPGSELGQESLGLFRELLDSGIRVLSAFLVGRLQLGEEGFQGRL